MVRRCMNLLIRSGEKILSRAHFKSDTFKILTSVRVGLHTLLHSCSNRLVCVYKLRKYFCKHPKLLLNHHIRQSWRTHLSQVSTLISLSTTSVCSHFKSLNCRETLIYVNRETSSCWEVSLKFTLSRPAERSGEAVQQSPVRTAASLFLLSRVNSKLHKDPGVCSLSLSITSASTDSCTVGKQLSPPFTFIPACSLHSL